MRDLHHVELWTSWGKTGAYFNFPPDDGSDSFMYKWVKKSSLKF